MISLISRVTRPTVGKPIGSDLLNGLVTLPAIYFAEANPMNKDVISLPDGGWKNSERVKRLVDAIRQSAAIQQAMDERRVRPWSAP